MNFKKAIWDKHVIFYPSPKYINYNWGFGSVLGLILALQIFSGVFLAFYYKPSDQTAFSDLIFIINDVNAGYFFKYLHLNGATAVFALLYLHLFRGVYYRSFVLLPKVWLTGMVLFLLMILTAFLGYVLPWGQMSFWAATVITNLLTSLPVVGQKLIVYAHGAFSVQGATLNRFFVLHYLLAIVVIILVIYHLAVLHKEGSSNPFGPLKEIEKLHFYYYFVFKDLFFFFLVCLYLFFIVFLHPNNFNHPDNFNEANPLITPTHIVPEWYFLPFYAILRAIPNKLLGVIAMLFAIVCLFSLPFLAKFDYYNFNFSDSGYKLFFFGLLFSFLVLGYLGAMPAVAPFVSMSQRFTAFYFILFFLPLLLSPAGRAWRAVLKYFQIDKNIY